MDKTIPASVTAENRALIVEKNGWHAMTAAPVELGYPGYAVIFEISGHTYDTSKATKVMLNCIFAVCGQYVCICCYHCFLICVTKFAHQLKLNTDIFSLRFWLRLLLCTGTA